MQIAFEKVEDFDVPRGVKLSEHQEECIAAGINTILHDFSNIRSCKRKTRNLFKKRFQYDLIDVNRHEYVLDSDIEYNSEIFLYALYSVVKEDACYGYLHNAVSDELKRRNMGSSRYGLFYCREELIDFFVKFNIAEIREEAKNKSDLNERIVFLKEKETDFKLIDRRDYGEDVLEGIIDPVGEQLSILLEEALAARKFRVRRHAGDEKGGVNSTELNDRPLGAAKAYIFDDAETGSPERVLSKEDNADGDVLRVADDSSEVEMQNNCGTTSAQESPVDTHLTFGYRGTGKKRQFIVEYLHRHVGYKRGWRELIYLVALSEKGFILLPMPEVVESEFPVYKGKKSTISGQIGVRGKLIKNRTDKLTELISDINTDFETELKNYTLANNRESG